MTHSPASSSTQTHSIPNNQALNDGQTMQLVFTTLVGDPKLASTIQIDPTKSNTDYIYFSVSDVNVIKKLTANIQTPEQIRNLFALQLPDHSPSPLEKPIPYPKALRADQVNGKDLLERIFGKQTLCQFGLAKVNLATWTDKNNQLESDPQPAIAKQFREQQINLFKKILAQAGFAELRDTISATPFNKPLTNADNSKKSGPIASIIDKMLGIKEQADGTFTIYFEYELYFSCLQAPAIESQSTTDYRVKRSDLIAFLGAAFDDRMTAYYTDPTNNLGRILAFGDPNSGLTETKYVLMLDFSGSMYPYLTIYKQKINELINRLAAESNPATRIRIVPFSDTTFNVREFYFSQLTQIQYYISSLTTGGLTNILGTLQEEIDSIKANANSNHCMVIFTDGEETVLNASSQPNAKRAINQQLDQFGAWQPKIVSLAYGDINTTFLESLSRETGCELHLLDQVENFAEVILQHADELKTPRKLFQFIQEAKSFKLFVKQEHAAATPVLNLSEKVTVNSKLFNPKPLYQPPKARLLAWMGPKDSQVKDLTTTTVASKSISHRRGHSA